MVAKQQSQYGNVSAVTNNALGPASLYAAAAMPTSDMSAYGGAPLSIASHYSSPSELPEQQYGTEFVSRDLTAPPEP
jgi:hypothetical protein